MTTNRMTSPPHSPASPAHPVSVSARDPEAGRTR